MSTHTSRFSGHVTHTGHLRLVDRRGFNQAVRDLAGEDVEVLIRRPRRDRSDRQNRWWWGVAVPLIAEHTGYDRVSLHYALVSRCFGTTRHARTGLEIPNARSSRLTTRQFSELMEWAVTFAATELDVMIPLPDEYCYEKTLVTRMADKSLEVSIG